MKMRWYAIPFGMAAIFLVMASVIRFSAQSMGNHMETYNFETQNTFQTAVQELKTEDPAQMSERLIMNADCIVQGRYEGGRKVTGECFYSPVTIETVYKGNQALKGTKLYVVEDEYTFVSTRYVNTGGKAFLPLQDGNSYILLLKKVQFHPQRKLTEFERMQYYPITQTALGAFRISTRKQTKVFRWDQHIESMHSLRGYDLPVEDPQQLDFYYAVKDMVFQKIHYMKS